MLLKCRNTTFMRTWNFIVILLICFDFTSFCWSQPVSESDVDAIYENEDGKIILTQISTATYRVKIINNEGFVLDTNLSVVQKDQFGPVGTSGYGDADFFLKFNYGGFSVNSEIIFAHEFSNYSKLAYMTKFPRIYARPFFRTGFSFNGFGDVKRSKAGASIYGIYFSGNEDINGFVQVTAKIRKEEVPYAFYSTDDGPQGMYDSDTSKKYYRMVMYDYSITIPESKIYIGTAVNSSEGLPGIAWVFADSELFLIWGKEEPWTAEELDKSFSVSAYLHQDYTGSWLKNAIVNRLD